MATWTRLDRLLVECSDDLPITADHGVAGGASPALIAQALLDSDDPMNDDDAAYCRSIVDGTGDADEPA